MKYLALITGIFWASMAVAQRDGRVDQFKAGLDSIRIQLKIPGMAALVKEDKRILMNRGFGYSDLEKKTPVTPRTAFVVASLTKTFSSTLILQLVQQGKLNLDDPISKYGIDLGNPAITVRNLLTHTSEEEPGTHYQYNGNRFAALTPIVEKITGMPYHQLMMENILIPLKMSSSAPFVNLDEYYQYAKKNPIAKACFDTAFGRLTRPYILNNGKIESAEYQAGFGAFGGLITTTEDLMKYSDAVDQHRFLSEATQQEAFTPNQTKNGEVTPYGLGWFTQEYGGLNFYWHYGQYSPGESALFIKVPQLKIAVAVLCNTDQLSTPFPLGDGDLFMSPVGQLFYRCFVLNNNAAPKDFQDKVLVDAATMALLNDDTTKAYTLYAEYAKEHFGGRNAIPAGQKIAALTNVPNNQNLTRSFSLSETSPIRVVGVGENCSGNGSYWCDFGWIEDSTGKVVWQMQNQTATHAGGAKKNQKVDQQITLPAGSYVLHYKSDNGHAYNSWDSLPPDDFFWGIVLVTAGK